MNIEQQTNGLKNRHKIGSEQSRNGLENETHWNMHSLVEKYETNKLTNWTFQRLAKSLKNRHKKC